MVRNSALKTNYTMWSSRESQPGISPGGLIEKPGLYQLSHPGHSKIKNRVPGRDTIYSSL